MYINQTVSQKPAIPLRNAYFNRMSMALNLALSGDGLALVSDFLAQKYLITGLLIRPFELSIPAFKRFYVVALGSRMSDSFVARAFEHLLSIAWSEISKSEG